MNPRDPLTLRIARTVSETRRDAYAWWEGPEERPSLFRRFMRWLWK